MSNTVAQPSFNTVDKDELYQCPYDPVHRVSAKRFTTHLTKCRKNHSAKDLVECPLNARHVVPRDKLDYHISTCPDKEVIRQDINPTPDFVGRSSNRPPTPPPTQGIDADEDWECEASSEPLIPANAAKFEDEQKVDSYARVQTMQTIQSEIHAPSRAAPVDLSKMTKTQKKNYKRSQKKQQKRAEEGGEEEEEPEMSMQEKIDQMVKKHHLVVDGGGFVDFISGLNIYCQQNKINCPKYQEWCGVDGGFGFKVIIRTDTYQTNKHCKTKKEAKQNAAMVAMLALDIQFDSGPIPGRKNNALTSNERQRMRETEEHRLSLQATRTARPQHQQHQPAPPPSSFSDSPPVRNDTSEAATYNHIEEPMANLSMEPQDPEDDEWTTVPKRNPGKGVNQVFEYSMKVAGRGRGRAQK